MDPITRRFIAAFYPAYRYTQTTVFAEANGQMLTAVGKVVTNSGWKEGFLKEIREKKEVLEIHSDKYLITGVPFYNNENENEFKVNLEDLLNEANA